VRIAWLSVTFTWIASVLALALPAFQVALLPVAVVAIAATVPTICSALRIEHDLDPPTARVARSMLGLTSAFAVIATIGATVPAIWEGWNGGAEPPAVPTSGYLAPTLGALTLLAAGAALRRPTPRRLAAASITLLCCWPFWLGIAGFSVVMFDDHKHDLVVPWALDAVRIGSPPLALLGIGLGLIAVRATAAPPAMVLLRPRRRSMMRAR